MYFISKQYHFSASQQQTQLPASHPDHRLHGHNYIVEIILRAEQLDEYGFVIEVGDLKPFQRIIDDELDHRHLNDVLPGHTSSECLAKWLFDRAKALWPKQIYAIRINETPKIWAEYREE
jgi:6-pyruvoyltetrahydropterin/6-carboxytetrahydropterin synthase